MIRKSRRASILVLLAVSLLSCISLRRAFGQTGPSQPRPKSNGLPQPQPVSLVHLYWHFLVYQNHLDTKAAAEAAQGLNASGLRNHLQKRLSFSDADFTVIRTSSVRLAAEVQALDGQAAAIKAAGPSSTAYSQLTSLTVQREADIKAEILTLRQTLPPDKIRVLEAFLVRYFSPTNAVPHSAIPSVQIAPAAVRP